MHFERTVVTHLHLDRLYFRSCYAECGAFKRAPRQWSGVAVGLTSLLFSPSVGDVLLDPPSKAERELKANLKFPLVIPAVRHARGRSPPFPYRADSMSKDVLLRIDGADMAHLS